MKEKMMGCTAISVRSTTTTVYFLTILFLFSSVHSFYLPGVAPRDFQTGDALYVKVNKLSSTKTQLPYDYYYLKYCKPSKIVNSAENLGEVLRGDRIENSIYTFHMRKEQSCTVACHKILDAESAKNFKEKIDDEYRVNMVLDNLPVAVLRQRRDGSQSTTYEHGFRVGFKGNYQGSKEEKYFINNHLSFRVMYHKDPETGSARIVGFEVTPNSINHEYKEWNDKNPQVTTCNKDTKNLMQGSTVPQEVDTNKDIVFTYDVSFKESEIKWASRWDTYLLMNDDQIHWFSIINSLMIVLFLSGMVAMIMMRTLYRDIANYNQLDTQDEAQEETGWKLVHGDVFRPPINSNLLCVYVGTGVQIFGMTLVTMIFALLGFLSPSNRGGLMTAMVLLWVFMGLFAGYSSARLYKMFKGTEWKRNTLKTAFMFPGILFGIFFVLNALIWGEQSSGAVPFGTMIALVCLWFGISVPLVFVGSYLGFKKPAIEDPVKTNKIPRQVPEQAWYMTPVFSILIGGILPFGAVFIELFFILTSIWLNQFYYIFGFLFIVFIILLITCAEITVVLCYFQLCSEDYNWWWRAYLTAGSSAVYLFLYSIFYFFTKLEITKLVSVIDLYVMLLRFSSLVSETIPRHREYRSSPSTKKQSLKKRLLISLNELEKLKPLVQQKINELNSRNAHQQNGRGNFHSNNSVDFSSAKKQTLPGNGQIKAVRETAKEFVYQGSSGQQFTYVRPVEEQVRRLSLTLPPPKQETLSRHSIFGPNGLNGQWRPPTTGTGIRYPTNIDLSPVELPSLQRPLEDASSSNKDNSIEEFHKLDLNSIPTDSEDSQPQCAQESPSLISFEETDTSAQVELIRQPSPPPVLAEVHDLVPAVSPHVNEAGCKTEIPSSDSCVRAESPLQLHISTALMENFMKLAKSNTKKNLETCGVLAGLLKNRKFYITALIIPKQESTSDSCQTTHEEEIFEVQDKRSLFPLGWIHTHPTQSCFMSSIDLHTHYSYQIMLPESVAIVMAPTDRSRNHGIFRLTTPGGMSVIKQCDQRGFHPHNQPPDGGPIYNTCTDVYMNPDLKFEVIDLR